MKVLMLVTIFYVLPLIIPFPLAHSVTSIRMILTMNNLSFNDNHYLQIHGTAMGTKMAPSFANLFLGFFEANALKNAPFQPHIWFRYIDDIFMIWTEGLDNLKIFVDYLNSIHPTIKFTSSHSATCLFLTLCLFN